MAVLGIFKAAFSRKPQENWLVISRNTSSQSFCKTIENNGNFSFELALYLKINICEFWLIFSWSHHIFQFSEDKDGLQNNERMLNTFPIPLLI